MPIHDVPTTSAAPDPALRETLDLLSRVMVDLSARMEAQNDKLDALAAVVGGSSRSLTPTLVDLSARLDARTAARERIDHAVSESFDALHARTEAIFDKLPARMSATKPADPAEIARPVAAQVEKSLHPVLRRCEAFLDGLDRERTATDARLQELERAEEAILSRLREELSHAAKWRSRIPWIWASAVALGASVAAIASTVF